MKTNNKLVGAGVLAAIAASLCCITPVLAILAGVSSLASSFAWLAPFSPYFIALTILTLGYAWYQQLKPKKEIDCGCETAGKPSFFQGKGFLTIVTLFALLLLAFPLYAGIFYSENTTQNTVISDTANLEKIDFTISGMSCADCENSINHQINKVDGILQAKVSYDASNALVLFDKTKANAAEIEQAINSTGYTVTAKKEVK